MRAAIVGYGLEGQESAEYWLKNGYEIKVCDQDQAKKDESKTYTWQLGDNYLQNLDGFDVIVRTAGLHPQKIIDANSEEIRQKITTSVNEFLRVCPSKNLIGVTGTKGKGTTSTLITKMLEADGKKVHLGGNIGIPALEMLPKVQSDDWVILELSSFQLMDIKYSPQIAVCVMVVPEHLDWHKDLDEYVGSKQNLFKYQKNDSVAIYNINSELSEKVVSVSHGKKLAYDVPSEGIQPKNVSSAYVSDDYIYYGNNKICKISEVKLLGRHNLENICAAINAIWGPTTGNLSAIKEVATTFSGLEHRIEFVRELAGVKYYNDSFATTPETSIACIKAFPEQQKIIILGGSDKGIPFDSLADEVVSKNVRHAVIIGDTADIIATLLQKRNFKNYTLGKSTMDEIVNIAQQHAEAGDVVLLSTGCASFGLFKDYKDRGEQFKKSVQALS